MDLCRKISVWYIVAVPILAGLATLNFRIAGFNYTGFLWVILLPVGVYLLALNRMSGTDPGGILPCWPWVLWCGFIGVSLLWSGHIERRPIQEVLQCCMPLVVALLAASAVRTHAELQRILAGFAVALGLLMLYAAAYATESIDLESTGTAVRGAAIAAMLVGCVFLASFPQQKIIPLAGWGACLLVTSLTSSRMATLALLLAPMLHPHFKGRVLWKLAAVGMFIVLGLFIFNTETFQQRFFQSGHGTLRDVYAGDFKDQGRFQAWDAMWEESWNDPFFGAGVGASYYFVPQVWEDMDHIHNDYLRIFFEFGLFGFLLFAFACTWQLMVLRREIFARDGGTVRVAFIAAWLGIWVMLISCFTDNTIVYNVLFTNPLFALIGAGFGVQWAEQHGLVDLERDAISRSGDAATVRSRKRRRRSLRRVEERSTFPPGAAPEAS
jgi:O-antigen ligase